MRSRSSSAPPNTAPERRTPRLLRGGELLVSLSASIAALMTLAAGCNLVIGIDDYHASGTGGGASTGSAGACDPASCPAPTSQCKQAVCVDGACAEEDIQDGQPTATQSSGDCKRNVCLGGSPVKEDDDADVEERVSVLPGLYLSVTNDALKPLLASGSTRLRFCLGYAGWGPSQVEKELEEGSWLFTEASAQAILELPAEELWAQTLKGMGVDPAMLMISKGMN